MCVCVPVCPVVSVSVSFCACGLLFTCVMCMPVFTCVASVYLHCGDSASETLGSSSVEQQWEEVLEGEWFYWQSGYP